MASLRALAPIAILLTSLPLCAGCYDTATLGGPAANSAITVLASGPHDHAVNLLAAGTDGTQGTVRIAPDTELRLALGNGAYTPWVRADDLVANLDGVSILAAPQPGPPAPTVPCGDDQACERELLPWSQVTDIQIKNFDGGETLLALAGGAELVAVFAIIADKSNDSGAADFLGDLVSDTADVAVNAAAQQAAVEAAQNAAAPVLLDESQPGTVFTANASRRSAATLLVGDEAGVMTRGAGGALDTALLGVELDQVFDIAATFTALAPRAGFLPASWRSGALDAPGLSFGVGGRFVLDLPMDMGHHVFVPVGAEVGKIQHEGFYWSLDYELDFRLKGDVRFGLRPFNLADVSGPAGGIGWLNEVSLRVPF